MPVRLMTPEDAPALAALFREMQDHYGVACPPDETILRDLAGLPPGNLILVAVEPDLVGFAAISMVYPGPGLNAGLFLKELFVSQQARGAGIGRHLMQAVAALAVERGFARVDWTADRHDERLLSFYGSTGATAQPDKLFFRLTGAALQHHAGSSDEDPM